MLRFRDCEGASRLIGMLVGKLIDRKTEYGGGGNVCMYILSGGKARPKVTFASERSFTGDSVSGGPTNVSFFSHVSGAPCAAVNMSGMSAAASSFATCSCVVSVCFITIIGSECYGSLQMEPRLLRISRF